MSTYEKYNKKYLDFYREHPDKIPPQVHGSANGYSNYGCRCAPCTDAWRVSNQTTRQKRFSRVTPDHVHGTQNGYGNYGCRCASCTAVWTHATRERRQRRVAKLRQEVR